MTIEEAMKNTFVCENLPGGYARLSYEACVNRQQDAFFKRADLSYRYFQCVDCTQGKDNSKIYEREYKMKKGTCSNCGRSLYVTEGPKPLCSFCNKTKVDGLNHGATEDFALHIAKDLARSVVRGRTNTSRKYPWNKPDWEEVLAGADAPVKEPVQEAPVVIGQDEVHPERQPESIIEQIDESTSLSDPIQNQEFIDIRRDCAKLIISSLKTMADNKSNDSNSFPVVFDNSERDQKIKAWLLTNSAKYRREPTSQILIMLENHMIADREQAA